MGDFSLLGKALKAHIIAVRPGHSLNSELVGKIIEQSSQKRKSGKVSKIACSCLNETALDIRRVLDVLPHRFPFVLVDRVESIEGNDQL